MTFENEYEPYITEEGRDYHRQLLAKNPETLTADETIQLEILRFLAERETMKMN